MERATQSAVMDGERYAFRILDDPSLPTFPPEYEEAPDDEKAVFSQAALRILRQHGVPV